MIRCPNCDKYCEDRMECPRCGFRFIKSTELPAAELVFCEKCACHFLGKHDCPKR